ncbi:MAG: DUF3488 domain-containing protein, partial [Nitrososphaerales archaeon]
MERGYHEVGTQETRTRSFFNRDGLLADAALLVVALASGIGALRLTTAPGSPQVFLHVAAAAVAGHMSVSVVRRIRRLRDPQPASLACGLVVMSLVTVWVSVPSSTRHGVPTLTTFRVVYHLFDHAGAVIRARPTPLPPTSGVVLCFTAGAGLVGVLGSFLWGWARSQQWRTAPLVVALAPSFVLFGYSALLSSDIGRVPGTIVYVGTALAFVVAADRSTAVPAGSGRHRTSTTEPPGTRAPQVTALDARVWLPAAEGVAEARKPSGLRSGVVAGLVSGAVALVLLSMLGPALSGMHLDALPFPPAKGSHGSGLGFDATGSGPGAGGSANQGSGSLGSVAEVATVALIDNLQQLLVHRSNEVMFEAKTDEPTYWQVATLSTFTGSRWVPDSATSLAASQPTWTNPLTPKAELPVLPQASTRTTYLTDVSLVGLGGRLLPVPPTTVSVSGRGADLVPGIGALYSGGDPYYSQAEITFSATADVPSSPSAPGPSANGQSSTGSSGAGSLA